MAETTIQWATHVWNPTVGCTRVSEGCRNCYAFALHDMRHAAHKAGKKLPKQYAKPFTELQMIEDRLTDPLHWRKPRRVFVNSVSDLFHKDVPDAFLDRVFAVMALAKDHTFMILTKRAERMRDYFQTSWNDVIVRLLQEFDSQPVKQPDELLNRFQMVYRITERESAMGVEWKSRLPLAWPLPNVWLGVSCEDQATADERIPLLLATPAALRFVSAEPLLEAVDLRCLQPEGIVEVDALKGTHGVYRPHGGTNAKIDWLICGGESGPHARPFNLAWARSMKEQCAAAGVKYFLKQIGAHPIGSYDERMLMIGSPPSCHPDNIVRWKLRDSHGGDESEFPDDLQGCRAFPEKAVTP